MIDPSESYGFRAVADILSYQPETDVWLRLGQMKLPRTGHGASVVAVTEEILAACRTERRVRDDSVYGDLIISSHGAAPSCTARDVDHRGLPRSSQPDGAQVSRAVDPLQLPGLSSG